MSRFAMLFTPIKIGDLEVKNRIAMAPMTTGYPSSDADEPVLTIESSK